MESVLHSWNSKMQSPNAIIQTAPSDIVDHPYVVEFLHIEVMDKADCQSDFDDPFNLTYTIFFLTSSPSLGVIGFFAFQ